MYAQVEKSKENKSRAVTNSVSQNRSKVTQVPGFLDNRPEDLPQIQQKIIPGKTNSDVLQGYFTTDSDKEAGDMGSKLPPHQHKFKTPDKTQLTFDQINNEHQQKRKISISEETIGAYLKTDSNKDAWDDASIINDFKDTVLEEPAEQYKEIMDGEKSEKADPQYFEVINEEAEGKIIPPLDLPTTGKALLLHAAGDIPHYIKNLERTKIITRELDGSPNDLKLSEDEAENFNGRIVILAHGSGGYQEIASKKTPRNKQAAAITLGKRFTAKNLPNYIKEIIAATPVLEARKQAITVLDIYACHVGAYQDGAYVVKVADELRKELPKLSVRATVGKGKLEGHVGVSKQEYIDTGLKVDAKDGKEKMQGYAKPKGNLLHKANFLDFLISGQPGEVIEKPKEKKWQTDAFKLF